MIKQWIGRSINRAVKPYGYVLHKQNHQSLGDYAAQAAMAEHLKTLFAELGVRTVLDVGANHGQYYDFLRQQVGFSGSVYSFEPIPELAAEISKRAQRDINWTVINCALGGSAGLAEFNVRSKTGWSSLRNMRSGQSDYTDSLEVVRTVQVEVKRLDDVIGELDAPGLYIKLDTQGSDLDIMQSGETAMSAAVGLQTELEFIPCYEGAATPSEVLEFVRARGFGLTAIHPLWWGDDLRIGEADAVFRRL